jgi:hypothetical protein
MWVFFLREKENPTGIFKSYFYDFKSETKLNKDFTIEIFFSKLKNLNQSKAL